MAVVKDQTMRLGEAKAAQRSLFVFLLLSDGKLYAPGRLGGARVEAAPGGGWQYCGVRNEAVIAEDAEVRIIDPMAARP